LFFKTEEDLNYFKNTLSSALGKDLSALIELVPILRNLFPQNELPNQKGDLAPSEAEERIVRIIRNFLECVALDDRALVLFLDDLQWSSTAEASVLTQVISGFKAQASTPPVRNVLLIISYRINELPELTMEKMAESLSELQESGDSLRTPELQMSPLRLVYSAYPQFLNSRRILRNFLLILSGSGHPTNREKDPSFGGTGLYDYVSAS